MLHTHRSGLSALVVAALLASTSPAHAALTTPTCLASKLKAWGKRRKCEATEQAKALVGKTADPAKCGTKFTEKLAKLSQKASDAGIACRYLDNGNETVTDFDTGLQWEKKGSPDGIAYFPNEHDVDNKYTWSSGSSFADGQVWTEALSRDNGRDPCFAFHCDWRLPTVDELQTILLAPYPCGSSPCIDPIFGATVANVYWSATTNATFPSNAWYVFFSDGYVGLDVKDNDLYVRAVRSGL